jgi:RNA polymerase sigma-70 factor (ECF subfamily)
VLGFVEKQTDQVNEESPEYALEEKEFKAELEEVLAGMTDKQRAVFLMNRIDDLTYKEIAERLERNQ